MATALVAQVKRVLLLPLVGIDEEGHLTQEGVHNHVLVVDLSYPSQVVVVVVVVETRGGLGWTPRDVVCAECVWNENKGEESIKE